MKRPQEARGSDDQALAGRRSAELTTFWVSQMTLGSLHRTWTGGSSPGLPTGAPAAGNIIANVFWTGPGHVMLLSGAGLAHHRYPTDTRRQQCHPSYCPAHVGTGTPALSHTCRHLSEESDQKGGGRLWCRAPDTGTLLHSKAPDQKQTSDAAAEGASALQAQP